MMMLRVALIALSWTAFSYCAPAEKIPVKLMLVTPHKFGLKNIPENVLPVSKIDENLVQFVHGNNPVSDEEFVTVKLVQSSLDKKEEEEEVPWWQQLWNQYFGEEEEEEESPSESPAESPAPAESPSPAESPAPTLPESPAPAESPAPTLPESPGPAESPAPAESSEIVEEFFEKSDPEPTPDKHKVYRYNNQNYVISGKPQFYARFNDKENPVAPFFCIQTLVPEPEVTPVIATKTLKVEIEPVEKSDQIKVEVILEKESPDSGVQPKYLSDDPSVAQASPQAIAVAGVGGVAQSKPVATAVVGDGGLAVASPMATSIAGNFFSTDDEDYDEKKKL